jgi:serine/threonine protein kinase
VAGNAASESDSSLSGRVLLGRYRVVRALARGGMGIVYLGRVEGAAGFSKPVVIKTTLSAEARPAELSAGDGEQLFAREARIVSHLQHPGIVAVVDFGRADDAHVMVLEYVHGYTLGQWSRYANEKRGALPLPHVMHVILSVLDALDYAHRLPRPDGTPFGIIHRDISPGNVLIDLQGRIKLADFGIARTSDDEFKTQEGMFRGTLPYSAPEVLQGEPVDGRCDQYASAVLMYQLLTGIHPFKGSETAHTITRILTHDPAPVSSLRADVPPAVSAAIAKAMAKSPDDRFPSVAAFSDALRGAFSWSERDAAQEFATQIEADFLSDMPERLGIEPLSVRDASWREAQDMPSPTRVGLGSSPPELRTTITKREGRASSIPTTPMSPSPAGAELRPTKTPSHWPLIVVAGLAAVAAVAALSIVLLRPSEEGSRKLLVVEKQSDPEGAEPAPDASGEPALLGATAPRAEASAEAPAAAVTGGARSASTKGEPPRGAPLARAFQQQEPAIQRCFQQSPETLEGTPRLSVKFNVDRDGHVVSAFLEPPSVSGQPLGHCILGIARATKFGPQKDAVSFSIPIAARVIRH